MKLNKYVSALSCSLLTFCIDFLFIPLVMRGWPDFLWMAAMVLLPLGAGWSFYLRFSNPPAKLLFAGMILQYGLLIFAAVPISRLLGSSVKSPLGWLSYIGVAFPWPLLVTLAQFLMIFCIRKYNRAKGDKV